MELKFGADPELFVRDKENKLVSAHNLIPGTKEEPHKIFQRGVEIGATQVDGMAVEYNITPTTDVTNFIYRNFYMQEVLRDMLPKGYTLAKIPVADFGLGYISEQPKEATILGCSPDYSAYTGKANPTPPKDLPYRTASGHIHIGWTEGQDPLHPDHLEACRQYVGYMEEKYLQFYSGAYEPDSIRREMYGQFGSFRPKPYGVEYRVFDNFWVDSPEHMRNLLKLFQRGFDELVARKGRPYTPSKDKLYYFNDQARKDSGEGSLSKLKVSLKIFVNNNWGLENVR